MNERIRELAEQAWDSLIDELGDVVDEGGRLNRNFLHAYDKKFAELIVRDCIAIVEPSSYRRAYPENYRGGMDCLETLEDRVEKIKEHFGVEE